MATPTNPADEQESIPWNELVMPTPCESSPFWQELQRSEYFILQKYNIADNVVLKNVLGTIQSLQVLCIMLCFMYPTRINDHSSSATAITVSNRTRSSRSLGLSFYPIPIASATTSMSLRPATRSAALNALGHG